MLRSHCAAVALLAVGLLGATPVVSFATDASDVQPDPNGVEQIAPPAVQEEDDPGVMESGGATAPDVGVVETEPEVSTAPSPSPDALISDGTGRLPEHPGDSSVGAVLSPLADVTTATMTERAPLPLGNDLPVPGTSAAVGLAQTPLTPTPSGQGFSAPIDRFATLGSFQVVISGSYSGALLSNVENAITGFASAAGISMSVTYTSNSGYVPMAGQIALRLAATSACTGSWAGCALPSVAQLPDGFRATGGIVTLNSSEVPFYSGVNQRIVVMHELGHVVGLDHYDEYYMGSYQLMNGTEKMYEAGAALRIGDLNGVRFLRSNIDRMPIGRLDSAAISGAYLRLTGWALDPDVTGAVSVDHWVDGFRAIARTTAASYRSDVASAYPGYGGYHGYVYNVPISSLSLGAGTHRVCAYGINSNGVGNGNASCQDFWLASPYGGFDEATWTTDGLKIRGWAADIGAPTSYVNVSFYVDGVLKRTQPASGARSDVPKVYPWAGGNTGFEYHLGASEFAVGTHTVCVTAHGVSVTSSVSLGCRTVHAINPIGSLDDAVGGSGAIYVRGWAGNQAVPAAMLWVHIYVDGTYRGALATGASRPDVPGVYPGLNPNTGYTGTVGGIARGSHTVCAYAISTTSNDNPLIGTCRTASVS